MPFIQYRLTEEPEAQSSGDTISEKNLVFHQNFSDAEVNIAKVMIALFAAAGKIDRGFEDSRYDLSYPLGEIIYEQN